MGDVSIPCRTVHDIPDGVEESLTRVETGTQGERIVRRCDGECLGLWPVRHFAVHTEGRADSAPSSRASSHVSGCSR